jgi:hypothetical protein
MPTSGTLLFSVESREAQARISNIATNHTDTPAAQTQSRRVRSRITASLTKGVGLMVFILDYCACAATAERHSRYHDKYYRRPD